MDFRHRLVGVRKLKNEMKELTEQLAKLQMPDGIISMFKTELYPIRCAQVMQSQSTRLKLNGSRMAKY